MFEAWFGWALRANVSGADPRKFCAWVRVQEMGFRVEDLGKKVKVAQRIRKNPGSERAIDRLLVYDCV